MPRQKLIYFIAGVAPDSTEQADIASTNAQIAQGFDLTVLSKLASPNYGAGPQPADFVAVKSGGTVPAAYSAVPTFNPTAIPPSSNLSTTQAIVNNAQKITGVTGSGTVANIAVNPTTKAVTVTLSAS